MDPKHRPLTPYPAELPGDMLSAQTGTYALLLSLAETATMRIGRLGEFTLPLARYVYVGSAHGPGGLRARILRHLRKDKALKWHIDYLTSRIQPQAVLYSISTRRLECEWVRCLSQLPGAEAPIHSFGSSDCTSGCLAHFLRMRDADWDTIVHAIESLGDHVSTWQRDGPL